MPESKREHATGESSVSTDSVNPKQIKCIMIGIALILLINLALTAVGVVLGMQVKSEVEGVEQKLGPVMEMAEWLESSGVLDGVDAAMQMPGN